MNLLIGELKYHLSNSSFGGGKKSIEKHKKKGKLINENKNFLALLETNNSSNLSFSSKQELKKQNLSYNINNFYMNDSISRASETMANCTHEILNKAKAS